jgi:hypothetical protein
MAKIKTRTLTKEYAENYDRIFRSEKNTEPNKSTQTPISGGMAEDRFTEGLEEYHSGE